MTSQCWTRHVLAKLMAAKIKTRKKGEQRILTKTTFSAWTHIKQ